MGRGEEERGVVGEGDGGLERVQEGVHAVLDGYRVGGWHVEGKAIDLLAVKMQPRPGDEALEVLQLVERARHEGQFQPVGAEVLAAGTDAEAVLAAVAAAVSQAGDEVPW